jgi:hypothetical protein
VLKKEGRELVIYSHKSANDLWGLPIVRKRKLPNGHLSEKC